MTATQHTQLRAASDNRPRLRGKVLAMVLISMMLTLFLAALDQTIVDTAMPKIIADLQGFDRYTWVFTAYLLTSTAVIPIAAKLPDQFGRKVFTLGGVIIFLLSSALAGTAQTMNQLIIFRGLQGLGSGIIQALVFTLVADIFPPKVRPRWQGLTSGTFALASVVGPTLGGVIVDHVTWRWVFYANLPVSLLALLILMFKLPSNISVRRTQLTGWAALRRVDALGALTAAGATICLLVGLTWGGQSYPWNSVQVLSLLGAAAGLVAIFLIREHKASEPILPLGIVRNRVVASGALLALTTNMALLALLVYLPLFIQGVLGHSATSSGLTVTPLTVAVVISAVIGGQLVARVGRYQWAVVLGTVVFAAGVLLMTRMTLTTGLLEITGSMIVVGLGVGLIQPVLTVAVQNAIPRTQLGVATGTMTYLRSMGSTLGVALMGTVVNTAAASELGRHLPVAARRLPADVLAAATNPQMLVNAHARHTLVTSVVHGALQQAVRTTPAQQATISHQVTDLFNQIFEAARQALAVGISHAFVASLVICGVAFLIALFLKDVPLKNPEGAEAEESEGEGELSEPPVAHELSS